MESTRLQRNPDRTRRALLDAAARLVVHQGTSVSLEVLAREAGVSKGGLLHHFKSKESLFEELADDLNESFVDAVRRNTDPADTAPGSLMRAYVKATFDDLVEFGYARDHAILWAALGTIPGVAERCQADAARWDAALADDGLDPQRVLLISRTADGLALAALFEAPSTAAQLDGYKALLLALTEQSGPLVEV